MSGQYPQNFGAQDAANADLRRPEVSLRFVLPLLNLLSRKHGREKVDAVVQAAGLNPSVLTDTGAWVSLKFLGRLRDEIFRQLYALHEPPPRTDPLWQLWRQAGVEAFEHKSLGNFLVVLRAFGSPGPLYRSLPKGIRRASTGLESEVVSYMPCRAVISVFPRDPESYKEGFERCLGRIGILEGMPLIWGLPRARVEHTHCMHDPDNPASECKYIVNFIERPIWRILSSLFSAVLYSILAVMARKVLVPYVSIETSILLNGLLIGLAIEAWRSTISIRSVRSNDLKNMRDLLNHHDQRYMDLWRESDELRRLALDNRNISTYIPKALLDKLRGRQQPPSLGGSKREVTTVFVDIERYSTVSEHLDPEQTIRVLNECFSAWVADVQAHGGTVLEFLGDGMLAVFGAPNDLANHATQAMCCMKTMINTMEKLNKSWSDAGLDQFWKHKNIAQLSFRAGVHSGIVVAGNLGSVTQMKYAVVGDTVNVAARLEQLNKKLGSKIAISGETEALLPEGLKSWLIPRGRHLVKGRDQPVEVFSCSSTQSIPQTNGRRWSLQ